MMSGQAIEEMSAERASVIGRLPLVAAACVICAIAFINIYRLTTAVAPRNPWESLEVVEAWRSLRGLPVYELPPGGHATHMYGAIVPWVQGEIFRWTGPNNFTGRLLSLVSALLLVTALAVFFAGERSIWAIVVAWAALLGVDHRSGHYFAENRPDMPALFLGTMALLLCGCGFERRRLRLVVFGMVCLVLGFFFKQTVSIFAAVPLCAMIMRGRRPTRLEIVLAGLPLLAMAGVIAGLGFVSESIHHYMIAVPRAYSINWARAGKYLWEVLLDSPLFLVMLAELLIFSRGVQRDDRRARWLLATLAIAIPFSAVSHAKVGGWPNSLLPALFAMMAFCVLRLPELVKRIENQAPTACHRLAFGAFLSALLLMTTFPHLTWENGLVVPRPRWDKDYRNTLAVSKALPGIVVCPEDPTIPFYGNGYVGRSLFSEKDARPDRGKWPKATPEPVLEEMRRAEFIVDVCEYWGENVDGALLESLGFVPMEVQSIDPDCYRIWRKARRNVTGVSTPEPGWGRFHKAAWNSRH